jgi:hypothetical protein
MAQRRKRVSTKFSTVELIEIASYDYKEATVRLKSAWKYMNMARALIRRVRGK